MLAASLLGTLPQWLTVAVLLTGGYLVTRGSAGPALEIERNANSTLRERNADLERQLADRVKEVAALTAKTDLAPMQATILERMQGHEARAQSRFEHTTRILELIADRLGPDGNGA